ncbi:Down syndrome cell adhesion molecule-like protein Dscam2, partial [Leptotrombidium deliense]
IIVPLKWKYEPRSLTTAFGTDIILECDAIGYPQPIIKWFKNEPFKQLITEQSVLKIEKITLSNNSTYECVAENGVDVSLRKDIRVNVVVPKIQPFIPPNSITEGEQFSLFCTLARGSKPMIFKWLKDKEVMENNADIKIDNSDDHSKITFNN